MVQIIAQILTPAVAVALSPMPIAALLLILLSNRARSNSLGFLFGWIAGLWIVVFLSIFLTTISADATGGSRNSLKNVIDGILGVILIWIAIKSFLGRPKKGEIAKMPAWMETIENFSPVKSFAIGLLLSTINFKNTPMGILAGTNISQTAQTNAQIWMGILSYILIGASTVIIPVIGFLIFGNRLQTVFGLIKNWMVENNWVIMCVLFLILGVVILSKAFGG